MKVIVAALLIVAATGGLASVSAQAPEGTLTRTIGADVILGVLDNTQVYARSKGIAAIAASTTSCNLGDTVVNWIALPSNQHPTITLNLYRMANGRIEQIGQSWVKHGFEALQGDVCNLGCKAHAPNGLGPGCSDPYGAGINRGPFLGARSQIDPTTGDFNANNVQDALNRQPSNPTIERGLQVKEQDLGIAGARYFIEGHYIAADDASALNSMNNVSYREIRIEPDANSGFVISNAGFTERLKPALSAWESDGAKLIPIDLVEATVAGKDIKSRIIVGYKATRLDGGNYRYVYAVYNMNSGQGIRSFSVPVGNAAPTDGSVHFHGVFSHGDPSFPNLPGSEPHEPWSNDDWHPSVQNGVITWSTKKYDEDKSANAIRWGTTYTFWFDAEKPPRQGTATVARFKSGKAPDVSTVLVDVPAQ